MSRLNPNAGAFVPSFTAPVASVNATSTGATTAPASSPTYANKPSPAATASSPAKEVATASGTDAKPAPVISTSADELSLSDQNESNSNRITYSIEYLLQFQPICDTVPCYFPDVVRAPAPQRLGRYLNDRLVYSVPELLQFQPLYTKLPEGILFTDTLDINPENDDKKAKTPSKSKKEKAKQKAAAAAAVNEQLQYDPTLMCYFNPTEYAAALNMAMYGSDKKATSTDAAGGSKTAMNPVEEAVVAKRRLATLLDDVHIDSITTILKSFEDVEITCTHTLQEVIGLLFDRSIAAPEQCDAYAQLCSGIAERTPEFKEGAKTINFRRILLTRCYEALVEEPEMSAHSVADGAVKPTASGSTAAAQHSWRRQCMLHNVCFIGELFRRQLLTENVMHVCVAMMLEDDVNPQVEVVDAACRLLALVGDLLDGSSPASRRTMDEYFEVLARIADHASASVSLKATIDELRIHRSGGWIKKRLDPSGSPVKATISTTMPAPTVTEADPVAAKAVSS